VVVAHADLPLATGLRHVVGSHGVLLVPDRRADGTNVIALPAACGFRFAYGPGSFHRHRAEAERLGLVVTVLDDGALGVGRRHPRRPGAALGRTGGRPHGRPHVGADPAAGPVPPLP
jgi:2-phospho-L-lactate guanylyltransferase